MISSTVPSGARGPSASAERGNRPSTVAYGGYRGISGLEEVPRYNTYQPPCSICRGLYASRLCPSRRPVADGRPIMSCSSVSSGSRTTTSDASTVAYGGYEGKSGLEEVPHYNLYQPPCSFCRGLHASRLCPSRSSAAGTRPIMSCNSTVSSGACTTISSGASAVAYGGYKGQSGLHEVPHYNMYQPPCSFCRGLHASRLCPSRSALGRTSICE
eukprot:gb/GEZN01010821.1/.p1 GENE.gb/GEZN01010821.1/~~gb/GEZN01010821.1/.p1  ORF type:complete len:214 (+),score=1.33 gb/GEZN01010821.1/:155-796(+)